MNDYEGYEIPTDLNRTSEICRSGAAKLFVKHGLENLHATKLVSLYRKGLKCSN